MKKKITRRSFVGTSLSAGLGVVTLPHLISCSPGNKLNIAVIGVGGRGERNWEVCTEENIVALCDVDDNLAAKGFETFPEAKKFKDFRVMFDKMSKEIDAVIISTPNHTHFAATMHAMQLGKHVFVEKPLAHDVWQVRTLKKAAEYYNVVSQMGNQGHATDGIRRIKEWYDAGLLGEVKEVLAWFDGPNLKPDGRWFAKPENFPPETEAVPDTLDWDLWLGEAPETAFNSYLHPKRWRGWWDYGNGLLGDWACHTLDGPFWALNPGMPDVIESELRTPSPEGFMADESIIRLEFPSKQEFNGLSLKWHEGGHKPDLRSEWTIDELPPTGMIMVGDKRSLITGGRPDNVDLLISDEEKEDLRSDLPDKTIPRIEGGHVQEWLRAIKDRGPKPGSSFDYASDLTEMILLGTMAQRFNTRLEYDSKKMMITNNPDLDKYLKEPARKGWEYDLD